MKCRLLVLLTLFLNLFSTQSYGVQDKCLDEAHSKCSPCLVENISLNGFGEISAVTGRAKTVYVRGYYRKDGTYVKPHFRSKPTSRNSHEN